MYDDEQSASRSRYKLRFSNHNALSNVHQHIELRQTSYSYLKRQHDRRISFQRRDIADPLKLPTSSPTLVYILHVQFLFQGFIVIVR